MTVSAVIPHLDRADLLDRALGCLAAQRLPPGTDLEVIVVDNGSSDGSARVAAGHGARRIPLGANQGFSKALNRGLAAARGDWIAVLNDDVEIAPDWLAALLGAAQRDEAWFSTGKVYDALRPDLLDGAGDAVCRGGAAWRIGHGRRDGPEYSRPRVTYFPSATAALFRREFFERAGTFDERFFAYLEDVDLGMRAARLGLEGVYVPDALAWHRGSATAGRWSDRSVFWITRHQLLLIAKHYSEALLLQFALPVLAAQLLWAGMALSRGRFRAWLSGVLRGLEDCRSHWNPDSRQGEQCLAAALRAGEGEIAALQRAGGWDVYWRWYFRMAGPPAEKSA